MSVNRISFRFRGRTLKFLVKVRFVILPELRLTIPRNLSVRQFLSLSISTLCDQPMVDSPHRDASLLLRVITGLIAGDTSQFKATSLILQGGSMHREYPSVETFMAIYQHQSQHHNHDEPQRDLSSITLL
jgi:hypothetical protein